MKYRYIFLSYDLFNCKLLFMLRKVYMFIFLLNKWFIRCYGMWRFRLWCEVLMIIKLVKSFDLYLYVLEKSWWWLCLV